MGLGMIANQLADLKLGELLDTPPPGLDEAVAIAKVWAPSADRQTITARLHQKVPEQSCGAPAAPGLPRA